MAGYWRENRKQLLILILLPILVFPWAATGASRFAGVDIAKQHQPMRWFDVQSVRHGEWPLWNPDIFSGFPQFAEGENGFLYLGNLPLYIPVDFSYMFGLILLLHFALAGVVAYACLRHYGLEKSLACGFAVVWAYSPFFIFHLSAPTILMVLAWYPALLLLADMFPGRPLRQTGWLAILASQVILIGSIQMAFFGFVAFFIFAIVRWVFSRDEIPGAGFRYLGIPLTGFALAGVIAAVQLLPTYELVSFTERASSLAGEFRALGSWLDFTRLGSIFVFPFIGNFDELIHYGSSVLYQGFIPGLLLMCALFYGWRRNWIRVHLIVGIILVLLAMGTRNPFNAWMSAVPPFDKFRYYGRFAGFASWHLMVASALWLSQFLADNPAGKMDLSAVRKWFGWPVLVSAILLAIYFIANKASLLALAGIAFSVVQLAAAWILVRRATWRRYLAAAAAVFAILLAYPLANLMQVDTGEYHRVFETYKRLAEERPNGRIFIDGPGPIISTWGSRPLFIGPYKKMKSFASGDGPSLGGLDAISGYASLKFESWRKIVQWDFPGWRGGEDELKAAVYALIKPDYIVKRDDIPVEWYAVDDSVDLDGIAEDGYFMRRVSPSPGYYLAAEVVTHSGLPPDELLNLALFSAGGYSVHVLGKLPAGERSIAGKVTAFERVKHGIRIEGLFEGESFLVVRDSWYPGWRGYVDGEEREVYLVDGLYKGIEVPEGEHVIEMKYEPGVFRVGMILSLIGLVIGIGLVVVKVGRDVEVVKKG